MHIDGAALATFTFVLPWALLVTLVDLRHRRIPVRLQLAGIAVSAIAVGAHAVGDVPGPSVLVFAACGALALAALYFTLRLLAPHHLGGGDLRIAPAVGALGGIGGVDGIVVVGIGPFAVTAVIGIVLLAGRGPRYVAHGPSMVGCAVLATALGG